MVSRALEKWRGLRTTELDALFSAHLNTPSLVGGPGLRYATEQINFAYVVAIAAQFQGFSRDLHTEATQFFVASLPPWARAVVENSLTKNRKLDSGNANEGNIAADFGRIGMADFWADVARVVGTRTVRHRKQLERMNAWRNAIAHDSFNFSANQLALLEVARPQLAHVRKCRVATGVLATGMARAVGKHLRQIVGKSPW